VSEGAIREYEQSTASRTDLLPGELLRWGLNAYSPEGSSLNEVAPFISPLNHPFKTQTPLFLNAGTREGFFKSVRTFSEQMSEVEGNRVLFHASEKMPHDFFITWPVLGTKAEAGTATSVARRFFESLR
jgi:hypothetical protein